MPFLNKMVKQRNSGKRACHCTVTTEESQFTRKLKKTKKKERKTSPKQNRCFRTKHQGEGAISILALQNSVMSL